MGSEFAEDPLSAVTADTHRFSPSLGHCAVYGLSITGIQIVNPTSKVDMRFVAGYLAILKTFI